MNSLCKLLPQVVVDICHLHDRLPAVVQNSNFDRFRFCRKKFRNLGQFAAKSSEQKVTRVAGIVQSSDHLTKPSHFIWNK